MSKLSLTASRPTGSGSASANSNSSNNAFHCPAPHKARRSVPSQFSSRRPKGWGQEASIILLSKSGEYMLCSRSIPIVESESIWKSLVEFHNQNFTYAEQIVPHHCQRHRVSTEPWFWKARPAFTVVAAVGQSRSENTGSGPLLGSPLLTLACGRNSWE